MILLTPRLLMCRVCLEQCTSSGQRLLTLYGILMFHAFAQCPYLGLWGVYTIQQTSSNSRVFWIHLLEVCWTFAGSCKRPIMPNSTWYWPCIRAIRKIWVRPTLWYCCFPFRI